MRKRLELVGVAVLAAISSGKRLGVGNRSRRRERGGVRRRRRKRMVGRKRRKVMVMY